jgi:DNA-binding NarL/FixJ family response regulator
MNTPTDGESLRAFLVCPEEYPTLCAESVLRSHGCQVWECGGMRDALALAQEETPRVILCPAAWAHGRSADLAAELRKRTRTRSIRVIAVCAPEVPADALPTEGTVLRSNASPEELVRAVWRALQRETRTRTRIRLAPGGEARPTA